MNNKLKIGIDLDDVVFEFMKTLIVYYKEKTGKQVLFNQIFSYKLSDILELNHKDILEIIFEMAEKNIDLNMELCLYAKESILKLANNYDIYFITSRVHKKNALESLQKHFSDIDFELFFSSNPYVGNSGKHKGEIGNEIGIHCMIEDSYEHAINCAESGIKCFLIDKPWNQRENLHEKIIRVKNWNEILGKLK